MRALFRPGRKPDAVECAVAAESGALVEQCQTQVALVPSPGPQAPLLGPSAPAEDLAGAPGSAPATDPGEMLLRVDGLSVDFGGLRAVADVSLSVKEGQIAALIGPNGAGKTTLFNAVSRLQTLSAGGLWFAGQDITSITPADVSRLGMARPFQNIRIFPNMSVLENVLVGCHRHERSGFFATGLGLPTQRPRSAGRGHGR